MGDTQICMLIEEILKTKQTQTKVEEQLVEFLKPPTYKKWMYERVTNQYKHQRILVDIAKQYSGADLTFEPLQQEVGLKNPIHHQIKELLDEIEKNIEALSMAMQPIEDFKTYKKFQELLKDEYAHQNRLMRMFYSNF